MLHDLFFHMALYLGALITLWLIYSFMLHQIRDSAILCCLHIYWDISFIIDCLS